MSRSIRSRLMDHWYIWAYTNDHPHSLWPQKYFITLVWNSYIIIHLIVQNEWMDEWMNEWMNGWMNEWMSEWKNELTNEWTNEWMNELRNEWMNEWINEWMNEWTQKQTSIAVVSTLTFFLKKKLKTKWKS